MIIKYIENKSGFWFFSKDRVSVITDEGEGSVNQNLPEPAVKELNEKLKDYNISKAEDFTNIKNICGENYPVIESCLIEASKKLWFILNPEANQIPRPMALILKKDTGIREFYVFSLDCKDFQNGLFVNDKIFDAVKAKLSSQSFIPDESGKYRGLDDKVALDAIEEAVKEVNKKAATFTTRIAVNFKFDKSHANLIEYITNLVFNRNIHLVINPFPYDEKAKYEQLKEKVLGDCYLCTEQLGDFTNKQIDFVSVKDVDIPKVVELLKDLKEKNLNLLFEGSPDVCIGLSLPIIKLDYSSKDYFSKVGRLVAIMNEIKELRELKKAEAQK